MRSLSMRIRRSGRRAAWMPATTASRRWVAAWLAATAVLGGSAASSRAHRSQLKVTPRVGAHALALGPSVAGPANAPLPLGTADLVSGPRACGPDGERCYTVEVRCSQLSRPERAELKVGDPAGPAQRGTILFVSGWTGTYFWEGEGLTTAVRELIAAGGLAPAEAWPDNNHAIIAAMRRDGYRTVQLRWERGWFQSALGQAEGMTALACKPATLLHWVFDNIHGAATQAPLCATGHSNGGSQVAYALAWYGLDGILSATVLESGPNWSRIAPACLHHDPRYSALYADTNPRRSIDWSFGFNNDGSGPCARQDPLWLPRFEQASLIGQPSREPPRTRIHFVLGGADSSTTAAQALAYHEHLRETQSMSLSLETVANAPHFVTDTTAGAVAVETALKDTCRLRGAAPLALPLVLRPAE